MYKTYKLCNATTPEGNIEIRAIKRLSDNAFIPLCKDNADYATSKKDISEGAEVQDAEGNVLDANEVKVLLRDLP